MVMKFFDEKYSKFLLLTLVLAFIISSISGVIFMTNKYIILSVDNRKVNINEFVNILNYQRQLDYYSLEDKNDISSLNTREYMISKLDKILYENIVLKNIDELKISPSKDIVLKDIVNDPVFITNNKFDRAKFNNIIKMYSITESDYISLLRENKAKNLIFSIFSGKFNNNSSINNIFLFNNKFKSISIFKINKSKLPVINNIIKDENLKDYYNLNIRDFILPEERKIDYIELNDDFDKDKTNELLKNTNGIVELAKSLNLDLKTMGYVNVKDINDNNLIKDLVNYKKDEVSDIIQNKDNKNFIYSVVDIKDEIIRDFDSVKKDIKDILTVENEYNEHKKIIEKDIKSFIESNYNKNVLNNFNESIDREVNLRSEGYDKAFLYDILSNNVSGVYRDGDYLFFAYTNFEGLLDEKHKNFMTKDVIENSLENDLFINIQENYLNYLRNNRYKVKIKYKLLDLIKNG